MSELKVDKISPQSGTATTIGDSGDTFTVPSGATLTVAGALNVTGTTALADGTVAVAELDIDGATDIGAAIVDADLFVIDDGAGGTNRKTTASRLQTYILGANSVDSDAYVDGSIDNAHIADDAIDSEHYADGSIDLAHMSVNSIDSDQYVDGSIDQVHLATGVGGVSWQAVVTGATTMVSGRGYFVNTTSSAFTMTLPASPSIGDYVRIIDYAGTFDSNTCTIGRNSQKIAGASADMTVTTERAGLELVFTDSTQGWLLTEK
jgi:hypothetical protein